MFYRNNCFRDPWPPPTGEPRAARAPKAALTGLQRISNKIAQTLPPDLSMVWGNRCIEEFRCQVRLAAGGDAMLLLEVGEGSWRRGGWLGEGRREHKGREDKTLTVDHPLNVAPG